jgi:hypothetical protein
MRHEPRRALRHRRRHLRDRAGGVRNLEDAMTLGLSGVCYLVAVILFVLAAIPFVEPWNGRLSTIGLAFFAAGHLF